MVGFAPSRTFQVLCEFTPIGSPIGLPRSAAPCITRFSIRRSMEH